MSTVSTTRDPARPLGQPAAWLIAGFVAAVCAALMGMQGLNILNQRSEVIAGAKKDNANLASSLIQQAELTFRTVDALLIGIVERLEHESYVEQNSRDRLRNWFLQEIRESSQFVVFAVIKSDGTLLVSSAGEKSGVNLSDRDYFTHHRAHDDRKLRIGKTVHGRNAGEWITPATRRINRPDGTFGGVALAAVNPGYFQTLYQALELGKNGAVLLASLDGSLLVRRPFLEANIGRDMSQGGLFKQLKLSPAGSAEITAATDGVNRLISYQQSNSYPLVVSVAQDVEELLAPWKDRSILQLGVATVIVALIALMGTIVWNSTRSLAKSAKRLGKTNIRFDAALANMSNGLSMFDVAGRLMISNGRFAELYNLPSELVRPGVSINAIVQNRKQPGSEDFEVDSYIAEFRQKLIDTGQSTSAAHLADGRTIAVTNTTITGGGWVGIHEDISERIASERATFEQATELAQTNMRFDAALSNMSQGISMFDAKKELVIWNDRYVEIYRPTPTLLAVGTHVNDIMGDLVARGILKGETSKSAVAQKKITMDELSIDSSRIEEFSDGRLILVTRRPTADGGWVATHEDITERRRAEAKIIHLARHDVLTGLANRAEFNEKLEDACRRLKRNGSAVTVMMLDLDKFKAVNDTLGHPAGDQLLVEVARRLKSAVRETDIIARLGGDEFAIIQEGGPSQHEGAIALALRIINAITQPFYLEGHEAIVGTSIGIALAAEHGVDPETLMKSADLALYNVKANGRNDFRVFQPEMLNVVHTQQSAESELQNAIVREEFELHYQPVADARTRLICGVEALVRWRHPTRGLVGPDQFIPLAESTGLIQPLGEWILQRACNDAVLLPSSIKVAINISAVQFKRGNLFDLILCALVETGLAPERLELEITETALLENEDAHLGTIRQLKNIGVSVALDDFGIGYSSMNYLTIFQFDKIKIDKSFTQGALNRREHKAVIASTIALARGLGIVTTAEGVETAEQWEYMREAGVDLVQGYMLGRPVPISQLDLQGAALANVMVA